MLFPFHGEQRLETSFWTRGGPTDARWQGARAPVLQGRTHSQGKCTHVRALTQGHLHLSLNLLDLSGYVRISEFPLIASIPTPCQMVRSTARPFHTYAFPLWW